jgi:hypothetical protein
MMLMSIQKIILNQKIANRLYDCLGDHKLVIEYQAKINERNHKENIINKSDIVLTDENGNYVQ